MLRKVIFPFRRIHIRGHIQKFPDWVNEINNNNKHLLRSNTKGYSGELTRLNHKVAKQLHLLAESCTTCSTRSRRPVRKFLNTLSQIAKRVLRFSRR